MDPSLHSPSRRPFPLSLALLNSWVVLTTLFVLIALPLYGPYLGSWEWKIAPVVTNFSLQSEVREGAGVRVTVTYDKLRACAIEGIDWKVNRVEVQVTPVAPIGTRLPGPQVMIWLIGSPSIEGSEVWLIYRCSPFWLTYGKVWEWPPA